MIADVVVGGLVDADIGETFNFYREGERANLRRRRLWAYLASHSAAPILLVGEAPGYRGTRVSGIPFTSERQLTGTGPGEATATIVHGVLGELGLEEQVLLWNVVPTHPGTESSNRRPSRVEVEAGLPFARRLARGRRVIAVGRLAEGALAAPYVRHPSHGGARAFRNELAALLKPRTLSRLCLKTQNLGEAKVSAREVTDHRVEVFDSLLGDDLLVEEDVAYGRVTRAADSYPT